MMRTNVQLSHNMYIVIMFEYQSQNQKDNIQGVFFNWPSPFSVPKRKTAFSQPELLFHEILPLRKPLIGSLAYFLFGTEQGGAS